MYCISPNGARRRYHVVLGVYVLIAGALFVGALPRRFRRRTHGRCVGETLLPEKRRRLGLLQMLIFMRKTAQGRHTHFAGKMNGARAPFVNSMGGCHVLLLCTRTL